MDSIYTNLENYDDFNKLEELKNENITLKLKIEEYTSAINKLQKDFDTLAVEHKKLESNYSSLLKTAKAEIERKTLMIKELNIEKDKLIINARQNNVKSKFNKFQSERFNSKNNKISATSIVQEQPQTLPNKQVTLNEYKHNNSSPLDTTSTCSGDTRDLNDALRFANKSIKNDSTSHSAKENAVQIPNKLPNKETETKVKKIMNRRKSMPASSCRDVNYSTDDERESSVTTKTSKTQPARDDIKRSTDRYYQNHKTYDSSSLDNNYTHYQDQMSSRNKSYYNDSNYRCRDSYDSTQRRRWNISPDRTNRSTRDYGDNYYQTYNRRAYDSPPRDKSYHQSRSNDRRHNYHRDRSRDYSRSNNEIERYAEKHRLQDLDEPNYKRQKYEYSHRYSEDEGRQRDTSSSKSALPMLLENSVSCQSPDYIHPDNHVSVAPIREIRSTAVMHLEDPRLSSKKYKIITDCDKEVLTTVCGRNVDIIPVNKKIWDFIPIPIPKALIEPPSSYIDNMTKSFNMDYYSSYNMDVDSNEISSRPTNGEYYSTNESVDYTPNNKSKDVNTNSTATKCEEAHNKGNSKNSKAAVDMDVEAQSVKEKNDVIVTSKHLNSGYKIPKKQNGSKVSTSFDTVSNKISSQDSEKKCLVSDQEISKHVESKSTISNNNRCKQKDDNHSKDNRLTENVDNEQFIKNRNDELAMSRKIVESDLTLSDDTSDNFEPPLTIIDTQTKSKCKKYKTKERTKNHKGTLDPKKTENASEILPDACNVEDKQQPEEDKSKHEEYYSEHSKKHKHKKKSEGRDGVDDCKTSKIKKVKKEKDATTEIKTKFSDLFGDSTSLITCDDLGVVPREPVIPNFSTIIEDTQDAVDIDIKEIEKLQSAKLQTGITQNEGTDEQANKQTEPTNVTDNGNKKCDDLKISIRKTEDKYTIVHEATEPANIFNNTNEVSNIPETVIISTGMQQKNIYNDVEFRQPMNVTCVERLQLLSPGLALATSTPAKIQELPADVQSDCSSVCSSDTMTVKPANNQASNTECQKELDVPDVRIFVKRRRKAKK